ncbi:nitroreductase [Sphingomonas canadensis]|uniref:nitroreductase n=1 Tax=Sphingomonas canadensis TaxID=1219257 RepID=UPI00223021A0|nr:nitroreductase [Sphingomonas canadensis]MCW3834467.1 nitroreductase [Sphingomonas canadensis]
MTDQAAFFAALAKERRSVRGFLPTPVPQSLLEEVFTVAQLAPSNCNAQPWIVHVVSGEAAERLRSGLYDAARTGGAPAGDFAMTGSYPDEYRARQIGSAKALFGAQGIARDDVEGRKRSFLRNFRFFDAPHAAFVFLDERFGIREAADCGMFAQTLMLALAANGLASCAQTALSFNPSLVRDLLGIPSGHKLLFGLAFGYEDPAHPANAARTDRAALSEAVTFHR